MKSQLLGVIFFFSTKLVKFFYRETVKEIASLLVLLGKALKSKSTEIKVTATRPPNHQLSEFSQDLNTSGIIKVSL